jgi:phytol kinase
MLNSISSLTYPLILIFLYLGILVLIAEVLHRFTHISVELTRKIVHIGSGHALLWAWLFNIPVKICLWASVLAGIIALISYFLPILPSIESVGRKSLGTFCYALSIGILSGWFWQINQPQYAVIGILVMAWGDGMAAIIGKRYGKDFYFVMGNQKSWQGSLTMMTMSFLVTSIILQFTLDVNTWESIFHLGIISLLVSILATGLESYSQLGIDNLTVPLGSAMACFYLTNWLF